MNLPIYCRNFDTFSLVYLQIIRARSKRGSRRLPRERSSEISKNCHRNSHIHARENKSPAANLGHFGAISCDSKTSFFNTCAWK